jgi:hypothetical protein
VAALKTGCLLVALVLLALLFLGSVLKLRALSEHTRTTYLVINLLAFSAKQAFVVAAIMYLWLLVKFDLVSLAHHQLIQGALFLKLAALLALDLFGYLAAIFMQSFGNARLRVDLAGLETDETFDAQSFGKELRELWERLKTFGLQKRDVSDNASASLATNRP